MKKILSLAIVVLTIFALVGCGKQEVNVPVKDIMANIQQEVDISGLSELDLTDEEMPEFNKEMLKGFGINLEDVEEGIMKFPMINLVADEVIIIKARDESKLSAIKEAMENHIENQMKAFENYVPENYELVKKHILKTEGKYMLLVISKDAQKVEEIFDNALK